MEEIEDEDDYRYLDCYPAPECRAEQLRKAPVTGHLEARIPLLKDRSGPMSVGDYSGEAEVTLSWTLERL